MQGGGFFRRLGRDTRAVSAVEYGFILGFIVLVIFIAMSGVATETLKLWTLIEQKSAVAHSGA